MEFVCDFLVSAFQVFSQRTGTDSGNGSFKKKYIKFYEELQNIEKYQLH